MTEQAKKIIKRIEKGFIQLAKETGSTYISAYLIDNAVSITDYTDLENKKFDYFNMEANNE